MARLINQQSLQSVLDGDIIGRGDQVPKANQLIQQALVDLGARLQVDGIFGKRTQEAVHWFQDVVNLPETGQVDSYTLHALEDALEDGLPRRLPPRRDFRELHGRDRFGMKVALTFDDGPDPHHTPAILDILKGAGVSATFFVQGKQIASNKHLIKRAVGEGHLIGNHSWDHPNFKRLTRAQMEDQLARTQTAIEEVIGRPAVRLARSPFGSPFFEGTPQKKQDARDAYAALNLIHVMWNVDPRDWAKASRSDPNQIVIRTRQGLKRGTGGVILMHDVHAQTVQALPDVLRLLGELGYQIVPLTELVEEKYGPPAVT